MKKILLIMPYGSVGGMERLALNFYNQYKKEGYVVKAIKIIQLETDIIHFGSDEIGLSDIDFIQMSFFKRFWFYVKTPFLLRKIIKKHQITHSIAFGDMANVFSSLTFTKEFKVASIHSYKSIEFTKKTFLNEISKIAFKTSFYFFDKVVCISNAVKNDLLLKLNFKFKDKLEVIYNPHDIQKIDELRDELITIKSENELFYNNKIVLFLGRLSSVKAPWHLIKAFSLLNDENTKLVFIGDGSSDITDYLNNLISTLAIKDKVVFLERKSNPYKYLKQSNVLALSSYFEGTPNVIVEAIATNVPVVTSNCTEGLLELMSVGESIEHKGTIETESGIITPTFFKGNLGFPLDDKITQEEQIFAKCLEKVLNSEFYQEQLIKNKQDLLSKFDLKTISKSYLTEKQ